MKYMGDYLSAEILLTRTFIETKSLWETWYKVDTYDDNIEQNKYWEKWESENVCNDIKWLT